MKQAAQRIVVFLTVIGLIGIAALSVRLVQAWRKTTPPHVQIPAPLTQAQVRQIFPGTMGNVATQPDKFVLYTIEPIPLQLAPSNSKMVFLPNSVDGYKITGKAVITDRDEQARLVASAFHTGKGLAMQDLCFDPHHALRLVKNKRVVDVIICFGCGNTQIWENGEPKTGDIAANPSAAGYVAFVLAKHRVTHAQ